MIVNSDQTSRDIGAALQGYLGAVGIDITLDPADGARYVDTGNNGWKEGFWYGGNGINPGLSFVQFIASNFRPSQVTKPTMARSSEFVDIYNKLMSVPDLTTADALGKQMVLALSNDITAIPVFANVNSRITQP